MWMHPELQEGEEYLCNSPSRIEAIKAGYRSDYTYRLGVVPYVLSQEYPGLVITMPNLHPLFRKKREE